MNFLRDKLIKTQEWIKANPQRAVITLAPILVLLIAGFILFSNSNSEVTTIALDLPQSTTSSNTATTIASAALSMPRLSFKQNDNPPNNDPKYTNILIQGSVLASGEKAGLSKQTIYQVIHIFKDKVNFKKDIRNGDRFALIKTNDGKIAAAELTLRHKTLQAIAFTDTHGQTNYYTPNGHSLKPSFLRFPMRFSRISSKFSLHRYHPILHIYCAHLGVDFAANPGTPVKATSDGIVRFAGKKHNYGNVLIIKDHQYSTLYAHLSHFAKGIKKGHRVSQGQIVAYSGNSGLSTGPHLHYEFRINGKHYDPLKVHLPQGTVIAKKNRQKFLAEAKLLVANLNSHHPQIYAALQKNKANPQS